MITIALFNNKGGVGKSTTAINVAHAMSRMGKRVNVVDCDSQQNTFNFFFQRECVNKSDQSITRYENVDVSNTFYSKHGCYYDYEIADLPPALDNQTIDILSKCDYVFVPIELGTFAISGIAKVTQTIAATDCALGGVFVNKFDRKNPADHKLYEQLCQNLGSKAMSTRIPLSRVIKNSIIYRQTAFEYAGKSGAVAAFVELTNEILTICREEQNNA